MASVRCKAEGCKKWSFQDGYCREHVVKTTSSLDKSTSSLDRSFGAGAYVASPARVSLPGAGAARGSLPASPVVPFGSVQKRHTLPASIDVSSSVAGLASLLQQDHPSVNSPHKFAPPAASGFAVLSRVSSPASSRAGSPEGARLSDVKLESGVTKAQGDPGSSRSELAELQARLAKAEADIKRERATNASLSAKLDSEKKARISADEGNKKLKADLETAQDENTTLKAKLMQVSSSQKVEFKGKLAQDSLKVPIKRNSAGKRLSGTAAEIASAVAKLDGIQVAGPDDDAAREAARREEAASSRRSSTASIPEAEEYDPDYAMFMDDEDADIPFDKTVSTGSEAVWEGKRVAFRPKLDSTMSYCVSEVDDEWSEFRERKDANSSRF